MRTNTLLTLLLSAFLMTGCVDSDYDLSTASTGDIAIGDENMELEIPIVTFTLTTSDIDGTKTKASDDLTLDEILALANAFMPSGESVNIATLIDTETSSETTDGTVSSDYIEELVYMLIEELQTSTTKRESLAKELLANEDLIDDDVYTTFGIVDLEVYDSYVELANAILAAVSDVTDDDIDDIADDVVSYLSGDILTSLKEYANISDKTDINDVIDIPSSVTDMLGDTTITPSVSVESDLPFKIEITTLKISSDSNSEGIDFLDNDTAVNLDDILDILKSGSMSIDYAAALNSYSTGETTGEESLKIKVSMKVKGAIKL